uniref:Uncharacterized protein n=1 Tax=Helianthus annuus TaxID=4232 RepID=A0A251S2F0_HELAN
MIKLYVMFTGTIRISSSPTNEDERTNIESRARIVREGSESCQQEHKRGSVTGRR